MRFGKLGEETHINETEATIRLVLNIVQVCSFDCAKNKLVQLKLLRTFSSRFLPTKFPYEIETPLSTIKGIGAFVPGCFQ